MRDCADELRSTIPISTTSLQGGPLSTGDGKWHPPRIDFFLPVRALSRIFRARFRDEMIKAGLYEAIPALVWKQKSYGNHLSFLF